MIQSNSAFNEPQANPMSIVPRKEPIVKQALRIASEGLRSRYSDKGILAGGTHFADVWIRDCCYAGLGALMLKDSVIVKNSLRSMVEYMKDDGQIPLRIGQKYFLLRYFHINGPQGGVYKEDKYVSVPRDSNSLYMVLLKHYIDETQDWAFVEDNYEALKKIIDWNFKCCEDMDMLMTEGYYAGWADSLKKTGKVLYTNVLHCVATQYFSELGSHIGKKADAEMYLQFSKRVKASLNDQFWNGSYYIDWIDKDRRVEVFSTEANVIAVMLGVTTKEQSEAIESYMFNNKMNDSFCVSTNHQKHAMRDIYPPFVGIRLQDYHNGLKWLWVGCLDAVAKSRNGQQDRAVEALTRIAAKIVEYDGVFEVYEKDGPPLQRFFYRSEKLFAWSSGLFVWACHQVGVDLSD